MKKIISMFLALTLVMSTMAVSASAYDPNDATVPSFVDQNDYERWWLAQLGVERDTWGSVGTSQPTATVTPDTAQTQDTMSAQSVVVAAPPAESTSGTVLEASPMDCFGIHKDNDGNIVCSYYAGPGGTVVIPNGVTLIDDMRADPFTDDGITGIVVPDSVTRINGISGYESLVSLDIGANVASIKGYAFMDCLKLTDITFRSPDTEIGDNLFYSSYVGKTFDSKALTIHGIAGGAVEAYAKANGIKFVADVTGTLTVKNVAYPTTQTVLIDGKPVDFNMYATKDADGNLTNYVKLRDIAYALNGTAAQFSVNWADGKTTVIAGEPYVANGSEMIRNLEGEQEYVTQPNEIGYKPLKGYGGNGFAGTALVLTDANGGAYTYLKLRNIGAYLNFDVSWTDGRIVIDTTKPYDANT